ncbi:MAG: LrgB family protein [Clostridiales bacterium]|nr:LrgB family protein [Clostridiales bacterium]
MSEFIQNSAYFGLTLTFITFGIGNLAKKKFRNPLANPNIISIALIIIFLVSFDIDYDTYNKSAQYLSFLLTPATICLAIPLYEQLELLKKNFAAIMIGIFSGVIASGVSILLLAIAFNLDQALYITLLPKSVTTAIGIAVSEELGGYPALTVVSIMIAGLLGNVFSEVACNLFRIKEPIARGVGIGTASHAMGTAKAMEIGEVEGAMSGLSIAVAGVMTVAVASIFAQFMF